MGASLEPDLVQFSLLRSVCSCGEDDANIDFVDSVRDHVSVRVDNRSDDCDIPARGC